MKVLLSVTSLRPSFGGTAYAVSRFAAALTQAGAQVAVWTADRSVVTTTLLSSGPEVQRLTGREVEALDSFGKPDIVHDHGIWLSHNHRLAKLAARRRIPRLVSIHGMLEPWALSHKRLKKRIAWWLYQRRDLTLARCLHATAEMEAVAIHRLDLGIPVRVVPNGVDVPADLHPRAGRARQCGVEKRQRRIALFLGRLHRKKGLPMLIEAWARVRPENWELRIVGPDESGHRAEVEKAIRAARLDNEISISGALEGQAKTLAFFGAELFVLPTHSENFGIAVAEALAHGLPVLTTTAAPWSMLPEHACGWWVSPTVKGIAEGLQRATSLDSTTLHMMGQRGRELATVQFGWQRVAEQFIGIYEDLCRGDQSK